MHSNPGRQVSIGVGATLMGAEGPWQDQQLHYAASQMHEQQLQEQQMHEQQMHEQQMARQYHMQRQQGGAAAHTYHQMQFSPSG